MIAFTTLFLKTSIPKSAVANINYSYSFRILFPTRSTHLGYALCNSNPLQLKFLNHNTHTLDQAKRRREATLFHYQRNFFISQVFGKGLNPHLKKSSGPPEEKKSTSLTEAPSKCSAPSRRQMNLGTPKRRDKKEDPVGLDQGGLPGRVVPLEGRIKVSIKNHGGKAGVAAGSPATLVRQRNPTCMVRCQTTGDLRSKKNQSQSLPTLPSTGVTGRRVTINEKSLPRLHSPPAGISQQKVRAQSTSNMEDFSVVRRSPEKSTGLPELSKHQRKDGDFERQPDSPIYEEPEVVSPDVKGRGNSEVCPQVDLIELSKERQSHKKDLFTIKKDPSKLFPKMKVILASREATAASTFRELMALDDPEVNRYNIAARKVSLATTRIPVTTRIKTSRGHTPQMGSLGNVMGNDSPSGESQHYVKLIQQLTAYIPEHLLAAAEEQIREMSNTDAIIAFKKRMISENHAAMRGKMTSDPRWQKLEKTLSESGQKRWRRRHQAWEYF